MQIIIFHIPFLFDLHSIHFVSLIHVTPIILRRASRIAIIVAYCVRIGGSRYFVGGCCEVVRIDVNGAIFILLLGLLSFGRVRFRICIFVRLFVS